MRLFKRKHVRLMSRKNRRKLRKFIKEDRIKITEDGLLSTKITLSERDRCQIARYGFVMTEIHQERLREHDKKKKKNVN